MTADGPGYDSAQATQVETYVRRGPVRRQLPQLGEAALFAVTALVFGWLFATVESLYPGTGVVKSTPPEKPAVARVQECHRVGPVSDNGFGYWWECRVSVRVAGGRAVKTVVGDVR